MHVACGPLICTVHLSRQNLKFLIERKASTGCGRKHTHFAKDKSKEEVCEPSERVRTEMALSILR